MSYPPQGGGMPPQGGGGGPLGNAPQGPYAGGSYLPPPEHVPGYGYGAPPPDKRSAIPKVIGILMIIFACLGLLFTLIGLASNSDTSLSMGAGEQLHDAFEKLKSWQTITGVVGLFLGILHLVGGIQSVRYGRNAPMLAKLYGVLAIALVLINVIAMYAWLMPMFDGGPSVFRAAFGVGLFFGAIFGSAWPIVVLALMTRPSAKEACVN